MSSSHYLVVRELLRRGHFVDFYAIEGWIQPGGLSAFPTFAYHPIRRDLCRRIYRDIERIPVGPIRRATRAGFAQVAKYLDWQPIGDAIRSKHAEAPFDALLVLGLLSPWRLDDRPTITWSQGTPDGEFGWYRRNVTTAVGLVGAGRLALLTAAYAGKYGEVCARYARSDMIIVESQGSSEQWERFGVPRRRLACLPYAVDLDAFQPPAAPPPRASAGFTFLHVGRIAARKRLDLLLDAFPLVTSHQPDARLLVIGSSLVPRIATRLAANVMPGIEYRQFVDHADMPRVMAQADCLVQPSEHENFGSAVAEAMACGLPVIVGPTNGMKDFVPQGSVVFDRYTPDALAGAMLEVIRRSGSGKASMAAASRRAAEEHFDPERVADGLCAIIAQSQSSPGTR